MSNKHGKQSAHDSHGPTDWSEGSAILNCTCVGILPVEPELWMTWYAVTCIQLPVTLKCRRHQSHLGASGGGSRMQCPVPDVTIQIPDW
jgi:hypothetical protein